MKAIYELIDQWGQLYVYEDRIVIERKGVSAFLTQGLKGGKTIPIASLTNIQFKPTGRLTNGYIQFSVLGEVGSKGGALVAGSDENTVFFKKKNAEVAENIRAFLEEKIINKSNTPTTIQALSPAEELKKFKDLLDQGIITQEEFDAKKKQLLGL